MTLSSPGPIAESPLSLLERPTPTPRDGEIAIAITACGVCRTDLQLCEGDLAPKILPIVPGHQIVGRVTSSGAGVTTPRVGDRVGVGWLAATCGACARCREGRENLCEQARFTGWSCDGGYATHAVVRAELAFALPEAIDDVHAAPLLCGGVIGYRSLKRSGIRPGQRLGLFGFGASALLAIQVARSWGCRVFVVTRGAAERARAVSLGAEWAGGYDERVPETLDAAVTFAPSGDVVVAALEALDRGGTVAINAIHLDRIPEFSYDALWWERNLVSVANYTRDDARELLALAAEQELTTSVDVFPLASANTALQRLRAGEIAGAAVLTMT